MAHNMHGAVGEWMVSMAARVEVFVNSFAFTLSCQRMYTSYMHPIMNAAYVAAILS